MRATISITPREWPCAVSTTSTSAPAATSACARSTASGPTPTAAPTRSRPCGSFVACGNSTRFWMSLTVIRPLSTPSRVDDRQLLDPVPVQELLGLVERRADRRGDEVVARSSASETGCATFRSKRRSRFVRMPTSRPSSSVIGTPEMWYRSISSSASETSACGGSVTGSTIIPDSERLTLSTSATCASIDRLRWMMPIPPSRASAIAMRASVTVSIAAETTGDLERDRARQPRRGRDVVRQHRRLGRDEQDVVERQPLLRELLAGARSRGVSKSSFPTSIREGYRRPDADVDALDRRARARRRRRRPAAGRPGAGRSGRRRPRASRLRRSRPPPGAPPCATGPRGARRGTRRAARRRRRRSRPAPAAAPSRGSAAPRAPRAAARQQPALGRDQHVARAHLGDPVEREQKVLLVVELLADERLGLRLVRRDEKRLRLDAQPQRLTLGVEHDGTWRRDSSRDRLGVEVVGDVARQRAGEDDELGALGQVAELLEQRLELLGPHRRPPLVDLGVGAAGRVDDGRRRARLAVDADEVVQDRLARSAPRRCASRSCRRRDRSRRRGRRAPSARARR